MQPGSNSNEDDLCQFLIVMTSRSLYSGYRILISVAFLVLIFSGLSASEESFSYACSGSPATIVSTCISLSRPKHTHRVVPAPVKAKEAKPIPGPSLKPSLVPILSPIRSPALSPVHTSLPVVVTPALIRKTTTHYLDLVLERRYWEAYQILSAEVRAGESFSDFKKNQNYTLFSGCWTVDNIFVSQLDNQNGIVNIELTNVSCDDNSPIAYYDWVIRLQLQQGHLVVVSIGLYPAAPAN